MDEVDAQIATLQDQIDVLQARLEGATSDAGVADGPDAARDPRTPAHVAPRRHHRRPGRARRSRPSASGASRAAGCSARRWRCAGATGAASAPSSPRGPGAGPVGFWDTMIITRWEPPYRVDVLHTGAVVRGHRHDGGDRPAGRSQPIRLERGTRPAAGCGRAGSAGRWPDQRSCSACGARWRRSVGWSSRASCPSDPLERRSSPKADPMGRAGGPTGIMVASPRTRAARRTT